MIIAAVVLSVVSSKIVYFGFTSNYIIYFSKANFHFAFDHDVFKYRILSKYLLLQVDQWLSTGMNERSAEKRLLIRDSGASERFYYALYYLNTFFLVLSSIVLVLLFNLKLAFKITKAEGKLLLFLLITLISVSQFVPTPYDISSYCFQLLILYIFLRYYDRYYSISLVILCVLVILSTLNRESAALSVSILILLIFLKYGFSDKAITSIFFIALSFLLTYFALRYFVVEEHPMTLLQDLKGSLFMGNNILGLIFWCLFMYLTLSIANTYENRWIICLFHFIAFPYIITCIISGVFWEIRLYIPLFLGSVFLSKIDMSGFKVQKANFLIVLSGLWKNDIPMK